MKKLLSILGAACLTASGASGLVSCSVIEPNYKDLAIDEYTDLINGFLKNSVVEAYNHDKGTFTLKTNDSTDLLNEKNIVDYCIDHILENNDSKLHMRYNFHLLDHLANRGGATGAEYITPNKYNQISFLGFQPEIRIDEANNRYDNPFEHNRDDQKKMSSYDYFWRPVINHKSNFYTFQDNNYYQIASSWPVKMANEKQKTAEIYWQGVITPDNNYYSVYTAQGIDNAGSLNKDLTYRWGQGINDITTVDFRFKASDLELKPSGDDKQLYNVKPNALWNCLIAIPTFAQYRSDIQTSALLEAYGHKTPDNIFSFYIISYGGDGSMSQFHVYNQLAAKIS